MGAVFQIYDVAQGEPKAIFGKIFRKVFHFQYWRYHRCHLARSDIASKRVE